MIWSIKNKAQEMSLNPHRFGFPGQDHEVYWATVQYARHWLAYDGPESLEVRRSGMTPASLRRIAMRYRVMRGFVGREPGGGRDTPALIGLSVLLNEESVAWPRQIEERAEFCLRLAAAAVEQGYFKNMQISALTKFMWFIKPRSWTMFDRLAADGLGIPNGASEQRMQRFYRRIQQNGLERIWRDMQREIENSQFAKVPAPRIVDLMLMNRGRPQDDGSPQRIARYHLSLLSTRQASAIHNLALLLEKKFAERVNCAV